MATLCLLFVGPVFALSSAEATQLLKTADSVKTSNNSEFMAILRRLESSLADLNPAEKDYLRYLQSWQHVYEGQYGAAVTTLQEIIKNSIDVALQFRARATLVNVLALATQYESAFTELGVLLESLPRITDKDVREQGLVVAALLYNKVGQFNLGLRYADLVVAENWAGRGICKGGQLRLEALYKSDALQTPIQQLQAGIDACEQLGEHVHANVIRIYLARYQLDHSRYQDALHLLTTHYDQVIKIGSPRVTSEYESLQALAYRQTGNSAQARRFAERAIANAVQNEYTEPLVSAYHLLYVLAKEQGEPKSALAYHEKYAAADKGYLDDVSARQLAYQRVKHQVDADKLQIGTLNKQNEVLSLQRSLADKAVENSRLYIIMLLMGLAFVVFLAYRTKRSQLHFRELSRVDGLTGVFNRQHFIEMAQRTLEARKKLNQEACVILCDLDHFKSINDSWGHAIGDDALRQTGAIFRSNLRQDDIVGRLGGEEFGILVVDCDSSVAYQRCERLRLALAEVNIAHGSAQFSLSASFGIAMTATSGYELRQLLADADAALYQAKNTGRNRVVQHEGPRSAHSELSSGKGLPSTFALSTK